MQELLDELISKALNEGEDLMRVLVSSANGLAAVELLTHNYPAAAEVCLLAISCRYASDAVCRDIGGCSTKLVMGIHSGLEQQQER